VVAQSRDQSVDKLRNGWPSTSKLVPIDGYAARHGCGDANASITLTPKPFQRTLVVFEVWFEEVSATLVVFLQSHKMTSTKDSSCKRTFSHCFSSFESMASLTILV
jgi:hypothetical protein